MAAFRFLRFFRFQLHLPMTRALPRTNFHSSRLIRFLADLSMVDAVEPGNAFAEKLGLWVDFTDAITLSAVHNTNAAGPTDASAGMPSQAGVAIADELNRIRTRLENSITKSGSASAGGTRIAFPAPVLELPMDLTAAYTPYRRYHAAHQRDMDLSIPPLRANVRQALTSASPALKKLAALDAALDGILSDREEKLLAKLPLLFKSRFVQLFTAHHQRLSDTGQADNPAVWMHAGGWLARFCSDLQTVLLAELDLRLQPALGLIEAFNQEIEDRHE